MPTTFDRTQHLARLEAETFDVLVVGGGITGVGVALDAASRGLRTALVERDDFSSGTSSKSSKLAHGGLRYLQQKEFGLVYEALYERTIMLRNAPHLVRELPFLIPVLTRDGLMNPKIARALGSALWMYDLTGGVRSGKIHKRITKAQALEHMPTLREGNLASAYIYYDAQVDDSRLTLTVARTAAAHGAAVANHTTVVDLLKDAAGTVRGATVEADGRQFDVRARAVVNAAGVWSDAVRAMDEGADPRSIRPAKGIHITVPWEKVRNDIATIVPVPKDRRSIFVVPWGDFTYIGTTDTDYDGDSDDPQCTPEDVQYCLDAMNLAMREPLTHADVTGVWAGLRPLIAGGSVGDKTKDLSRKHGVRTSPGGVTTITGGKLTTYRRMAADTVDAVAARLDVKAKSRTKKLRLLGAEGSQPSDEHLQSRYGSLGADVLALAHGDADLAAPLIPGLPYLRAEAVYAIREEMARTLADVLERRTRARIIARDASLAAAPSVAALMARELDWDAARTEAEVAAYAASIAHERTVSALPESAIGGAESAADRSFGA
ncbi:MAG: glycerol-3-phosphate dehydrogenase/oxidase [Actinomycetes bacterium]